MAANKGDQFRDDIAAFLRAVRKDVDVEVQTGHKRVDILWKKQDFGGKARTVAIECKNYARALSLEEVAVIWADYGALYEKQLIDEVLLITKLDISPTAKNYVNSVRALSYMTFSQLQDAVLNVQAYLRSLASSFTEEGTGNYYIASHCDSGVEAITFISEWIEAKARPTLAVLASYGMGKTTTARKIAAELADAHLQGMEVRIPIYVQLQEIVGEQSLEGLLGKVLAARAPIEGYHFDTFMTLNKAGRFLPTDPQVLSGTAVAGEARLPRPPLLRNFFGGSVGAPIKKDRAFFFFAYEGFREATSSGGLQIVPLPHVGQGIIRYRTASGASDPSCPPGTPSGFRCLNVNQINQAYLAANGITPGATEFTVISGASAFDRARVIMMTPALDAQ